MSSSNQIERSTFIRAPRSRVWRALTDIAEFCRWFSAESAEPAFRPGSRIKLASTYPGPYYKVEFFVEIVDILPEHTFSWRWQPGHPGEDLSQEPFTVVTFRLEDAEGGTLVTVTETGFDRLLASRRSRVFQENDGGWKIQMAALGRHFGETV